MRRDPHKKAGGKQDGGRPTDYNGDRHPQAAEYIMRHFGATDEELAKAMGISLATLKNWKNAHESFVAAYKKGKDAYDAGVVENALRRRALGYKYTETSTKSLSIVQGRGDNKIILPAEEVTVNEKSMAPDVGAAIFWLTNRQPDRWKQTRFVQHAGKIDGPAITHYNLDLNDLGADELAQLADVLADAAEKQRRAEQNKAAAGGQIKGTA